ncbi:uncharacterized protein LOC129583395 isoform X2 [Paramacrobiotus metropolitanus]|uniref:uncharacterized protein LOC129583395 isoform X2 n=1 Tax=Paramacrobiotus metropolitanus TaxID=2943436 RepID=UPI00244606D9|nr:uncharacterized protein LOC129583395 isoform X2 [Paramacrobiotus metropolitanus]
MSRNILFALLCVTIVSTGFAQFTSIYPIDKKLKIVTVEIPYLFNKDKTGFIPNLLKRFAQYGALNLDLDNITFAHDFTEAKNWIMDRKYNLDIFAAAVENDGVFSGDLHFTYPIWGSHVIQVRNKKKMDVTTVSVLSTTPTQQTMQAQPGNYPVSGQLGPPQGDSAQPGTLADALKAVQDGKTTLVGRTPVVDTAIRDPKYPDLFLDTMQGASTPLPVFSSFAVKSAPETMARLNAAIVAMRATKETEALFNATFTPSPFIEPPADFIPTFNTTSTPNSTSSS